MLRSSKSCADPRYLAWYKSVNLYVAVTHCLLGMQETDFDARYPRLKWVWNGIMKNNAARTFAASNSLRCQAALAGSVSELKRINKQALDMCIDGGIETWEDPFSCTLDLEGYRYRVLRGLHSVANYFLWSIPQFYPPILTNKSLRLLLVGYADVCSGEYIVKAVEDVQSRLPGCFNTTCIAGAEYATKDDVLLKLLYSNETGSDNWWDAVINDWRCYFSEDSEFLIDGENVDSSDFEVFMRLQAYRLKDVKSRVTFFKSNEDDVWMHAFRKSGLHVNYRAVNRLVSNKSLVDFELINEVGHSYYTRGCRKFYIMSSDSDFSILCSAFPDAKFVFICRYSTTSSEWISQMRRDNIQVYWIDESCRSWNHGIFVTDYIFNKAMREDPEIWKRDDAWAAFVERLGFCVDSSAIKAARQRLQTKYESEKEVV